MTGFGLSSRQPSLSIDGCFFPLPTRLLCPRPTQPSAALLLPDTPRPRFGGHDADGLLHVPLGPRTIVLRMPRDRILGARKLIPRLRRGQPVGARTRCHILTARLQSYPTD